jgi:hypothetical protein
MRRQRYDDPYRERWPYERAVLRPDWGRAHPDDPNWRDGRYHGMRTGGDAWQAPYGRYRMAHRGDLGGWGGYPGRYDRPPGGFDDAGLLGMAGRRAADRLPRRPDYDADFREMDPRWQDGGMDGSYLRQLDSRPPRFSRRPGW